MQNLKAGDVIENSKTKQRVKVSEVIRNEKYDVDGVPGVVDGHFIPDGVHISITFSKISHNHRVADWREWTVIERS